MADDLNDLAAEQRRMRDDIDRLKSARWLENAAVKRGRLRFIGGLLLIDSGGTLTVIGQFNGDGTFTWTGPWTFTGAGDITGDVDISGDVHATGEWTQIGPWHLNGDGSITGDVDITGILHLLSELVVSAGGKIAVQGAGGDVVLDSSFASPRIQLGAAQIDGGSASFTFTVGSQIVYFANHTIRIPAMATKPLAEVPGGYVGGVFVDASGAFYRITA